MHCSDKWHNAMMTNNEKMRAPTVRLLIAPVKNPLTFHLTMHRKWSDKKTQLKSELTQETR